MGLTTRRHTPTRADQRELKGLLGRKGAQPARLAELEAIAAERGWIERAQGDEYLIVGAASSMHVDRDGEIIHPKAIASRLEAFVEGSAPFAAAHAHRSEGGEPTQIGWVTEAAVGTTVVAALFRFARTSVAEQWRTIARDPDGKGLAFSVGFLPHGWAEGTVGEIAREMPDLAEPLKDAGLGEEQRLRVYTDIELLEISAVMAPSNRQSLQLLEAKGLDAPGIGVAIEAAAELAAERAAELLTERIEVRMADQVATLQATILRELDIRATTPIEADDAEMDAEIAPPGDDPGDHPAAPEGVDAGDISEMAEELAALASALKAQRQS